MSLLERGATVERRAFAAMARRAVPRPDCPPPERLWEAVGGRLPATAVRELVAHTTSCPSCAEDWRLARELAPRPNAEVAAFPGAARRRRLRWGLAAAAALLAIVAVPLWRKPAPTHSTETVRAPSAGAIRSSIADDAVLPRTDCVLRWSAEPESGAIYDLLVATDGFEILLREEGLEEPSFRVPEQALAPVEAGGRILWRVEAAYADGHRIVSPTFVHRLQ